MKSRSSVGELESYKNMRKNKRWIGLFWVSLILFAVSVSSAYEDTPLDLDTEGSGGVTSEWAGPRNLEGYAGQQSVNTGETVTLHISSKNNQTYSYDVYRMGWHGGVGGQWITGETNISGVDRLAGGLPTADNNGMIEADWPVSHTLNTTGWQTGAYLVRMVAADGTLSYIHFIVRDDSSNADILFMLPTTTYQAYNNWGGKSVYDFNTPSGRAYKISYERPYADGDGAGYFFNGDYQMIRWLEREGYSVAYAANVDLHRFPNLLNNHKMLLSNYHDEYYTWEMRQHLETSIANGVDAAYFTSNNIYWQMRFENSPATGNANRVLTVYKDSTLDPMASSGTPWLTTVRFRDDPVNAPENGLLGVMYDGDFGDEKNFPYVISNADHWTYAGTGLQNGDAIPDFVGDEFDKVFNNGFTPENLVVLSNSPIIYPEFEINSVANSSIYEANPGTWIFNASTNRWALKLEDTKFDIGLEAAPVTTQITRNILNGMIDAPQPNRPITEAIIYDEALSFMWDDNNSITTNYTSTADAYTGNRAIAFDAPNGFSDRLSIQGFTGLDLSPYSTLQLAIKATDSDQRYSVELWDDESNSLGTVNLDDYGGLPRTDQWTVYNIPLADLNATNQTVTYLWIRPRVGVEPILYIDDVKLLPVGTNTPPVSDGIANVDVNEDAPNTTIPLYGIHNDVQDSPSQLTYAVQNVSNPGLFVDVSVAPGGILTLDYAANAFGTATVTVRATDRGSLFTDTTFTVNVASVNDAPSFSVLATAYEYDLSTTGQQTINGWANSFVFGPADESGQSLVGFSTTVADSAGVLSGQPSVNLNGDLSFTLSGAPGAAVIDVQMQDNGGTASGGVDQSLPVSVVVIVGGQDAPANQDLIVNGTFDSDTAPWALYGQISGQQVNGRLQLQRSSAEVGGGARQDMPFKLPSAAPVEAVFELRNTSAAPKSVTVTLLDPSDKATGLTCIVNLPGDTFSRTVTLQGTTQKPWLVARIDVAITDSGTTSAVQVDNVSVNYRAGASFPALNCSDPVVSIDPVSLASPVNSILPDEETRTLTLTFDTQLGTTAHQIDVYHPDFGQIYTERVDTMACSGATCSVTFPYNLAAGPYEVWILPFGGSLPGSWQQSTFTVDMVPAVLDYPLEPIIPYNLIDISWPGQLGVSTYQVDIYSPSPEPPVISSEVNAAEICSFIGPVYVCSMSVPYDNEPGTYDVWIQPRRDQQSGPWRYAPVEVSFIPITTYYPKNGATIPPFEVIQVSFPAQGNVNAHQVDVYHNGVQIFSQLADTTACAGGECVVDVAYDQLPGVYDMWILPVKGSTYGQWSQTTFTVEFTAPKLFYPAGTISPSDLLQLSWGAQGGTTAHQIDVYHPTQGRIFSERVDTTGCAGSECVVDVPYDGHPGNYEVWMQAYMGENAGPWGRNAFTVEMAGVSLVYPRNTIEPFSPVDLTFSTQAGANWHLVNVYGPDGSQLLSEWVNTTNCAGGECAVELNYEANPGRYEVWIIAAAQDTFGPWTMSEFYVAISPVKLFYPTGNLTGYDQLYLSWGLQGGITAFQVDVYQPTGQRIYSERLASSDICTSAGCEAIVPYNSQVGRYSVWILPFLGETAGPWAESTFTITNVVADVDVLGIAPGAPTPESLDTTEVEAAIEGPNMLPTLVP